MNIAKNKNDDLEDMIEEISLYSKDKDVENMRGKLQDKENRCRTHVIESRNSVAKAASYLPNIHSF